MSETEEPASHAEIIDPGCSDVAGIWCGSLDGRCECVGLRVICGGGDGSYSEHARETDGVGNMPIDSGSGGIRDILSDGTSSTVKGGAEFRPKVENRGVVWSGRGVSSAPVSSYGRSYSTNVRADGCCWASSREACLDGKKRDNGGSREVFRGGDFSE